MRIESIKAYDPDAGDYEKISHFTRRSFSPQELYVFEAVLCDNDIDRDFESFSMPALYELQKLFIGKTGIKDHSMLSSDQTARVFDTRVEKVPGMKTAGGEDYAALKAKIYMVRTAENESLIRDIDAGIKKELSVSCRAEKRVCSVCGRDKNAASCRHIPGKTYGGRLCHIILDGISDAYEFSFVAVPAQRNAGVKKSFEKDSVNMTDDIFTRLKSGGAEVSDDEAAAIVKRFSSLEDDAELGRRYRSDLVDDIVKLCAAQLPELDTGVFKRLAGVMTANELISFKRAFEKRRASDSRPAPQLASAGKADGDELKEFRI